MEFFQNWDASHLAGNTGIIAVVVWFGLKILKPLLETFLEDMIAAIRENTAVVKELVEKQERASGYTREEHAGIITHLTVLTDTLLKTNGHPPSGLADTDNPELEALNLTKKSSPLTDTVSKQEFNNLRSDLNKVIKHLIEE